jgi:hypothetical protein
MTEYAIKLMTFGRTETKKSAPKFGAVKTDRVATFTGLEGQTVRCTAGYLWLTQENDVMDRVLRPGQALTVATNGTVIVGGKGAYSLETSSVAKAS